MTHQQPITVADVRAAVDAAAERDPEARTRLERGVLILLFRDVQHVPGVAGRYRVESGMTGWYYEVDDAAGVCACPDFRRRGRTCKHLFALDLAAALARLKGPQRTESVEAIA